MRRSIRRKSSIFVILCLICSTIPIIGTRAGVTTPGEARRNYELVNSLEFIRKRGFNDDENNGFDDDEQEAAIYVITKFWLQSPIWNKQELIDYFDSRQSSDGAWGKRLGKRPKAAMRILNAYLILRAKPKKSLDPFFSMYDTWEEVLQNYDGKDRMDKYHLVACWVFYYGDLPPWIQQLFDFYEQSLDWITGPNMHERTHILYSYLLAKRPFPNPDGIIDTTLRQQNADGSWSFGNIPVLHETAQQVSFLATIKKLYPERATDIQKALEKSKPFLLSKYKTLVMNSKTYGYFLKPNVWHLHFGVLASVSAEIVEGKQDPLNC